MDFFLTHVSLKTLRDIIHRVRDTGNLSDQEMINSSQENRARFLARIDQLLDSKEFSLAIQVGEQHLKVDPTFLPGRFKLAAAYNFSDRFEEAVEHLRMILVLEPNRKSVLFALAKTEKSLGNIDQAIEALEKLMKQDANHYEVLAELGTCVLAKHDTVYAIELFSRACEIAPKIARLHFLRGTALSHNDILVEAIRSLETAIALDFTDEDIYVQLAKQCIMAGDIGRAKEVSLAGLAQHPSSVPLLILLSTCETRRGNVVEAEAAFKNAVKLSPRAVNTYAEWLQEEDRFEESTQLLEGLIRQYPLEGQAYHQLANSKHYHVDGKPLLTSALQNIQDPTQNRESRMYLSYAIGLMSEKSANYADSMKHFDQANEYAYERYIARRPFSRPAERNYFERTCNTFTRESLAGKTESQSSSSKPILIVGMIRSGTTLLDQIVSSHPDVSTAGELVFWTKEAEVLGPDCKLPLSESVLRDSEERYLDRLKLAASDAKWITDKMPLNFRWLGLIHSIFPHAKIIHINRNPIDTCLSIYTNHFGASTRWVYNQSNIVYFYRLYLEYMEHWKKVLPLGTIIDVRYEDLIEDPEPQLRRILDACEIPWDDRCLRHDENASSIRTPSRWQARQPIYKTSAERWKLFEPYLGELLELRDLLPTASNDLDGKVL